MRKTPWVIVRYRGVEFDTYEVHPRGRIRLRRATHQSEAGHELSTSVMNGYAGLCIYRRVREQSRRLTVSLHRLVAETFLGPPPSPKHQVNHKNGNKLDNRVANLEWCLPSENRKHAFRRGLSTRPVGSQNPASVLTEADVREIRRLRSLPKAERPSQLHVSASFNITRSLVSMIENRKVWTHI